MVLILVTLAAFSTNALGQQKTIVNDRAAARRLLGRHMLSLQWVSWDYFGTATVTQKNGIYQIHGRQNGRGANKGDYVTIDGMVFEINSKDFGFSGRIVTRVSHINNGEPCVREGEFSFAVKQNRKYWRLQEMENPCDTATD